MALPNLTLEEAEELAHFGIPATPDMWMPSGWRLIVEGVPVAPVPEPSSHLFALAVGLYRARLSPEALRDLMYAPNNRSGRTCSPPTATSTSTRSPARGRQ
ncbi:hypothetical protein ZWY2020_036171 [Hordeum vulgare]|nr:hypothetical protein ZWY2020_036171 [Hordeum vulgare]